MKILDIHVIIVDFDGEKQQYVARSTRQPDVSGAGATPAAARSALRVAQRVDYFYQQGSPETAYRYLKMLEETDHRMAMAPFFVASPMEEC